MHFRAFPCVSILFRAVAILGLGAALTFIPLGCGHAFPAPGEPKKVEPVKDQAGDIQGFYSCSGTEGPPEVKVWREELLAEVNKPKEGTHAETTLARFHSGAAGD